MLAGRFVSDQVGNSGDRFSRDAAHFMSYDQTEVGCVGQGGGQVACPYSWLVLLAVLIHYRSVLEFRYY